MSEYVRVGVPLKSASLMHSAVNVYMGKKEDRPLL